ncbi:AraC family transcriptional regulator [Ktedonospora formicarum]|uniref:AraC family transcriptional regulator n=1 Tax=Ktedonospora formicarum TaxID=2778364 RepID=A0A8J3MTK3_9CHLR|nr:AraC family transcriptional regulator [Ktedonospora formicarum]GHO46016.1 AraC family transcriptional regulator [Ktedonospora formicarum]
MEQVPLEGTRHGPEFEVPLEHIVQSSNGRDWNGVNIAEIIHPLDDFASPAIPHHILVVNLGSPTNIQEQTIGRQGHLNTGNVVIMPAGAPTKWHLDREGDVRHLHLYLSPTLIQRVADSADINPDRVEIIDTLGAFDPQIETIALSLLSELRSDGLGGKLYVESLANLLGIHLLRQHSSVKLPSFSKPLGLARTTLKAATTYIEDHLEDNLSLSEIAAAVHLSPYHFARLFKESTGVPPHQYVIQRRVERAKMLLSTTHWSLTTIAHMVGFAHESHLALHFKRLTGLTPKHFR